MASLVLESRLQLFVTRYVINTKELNILSQLLDKRDNYLNYLLRNFREETRIHTYACR